MEIDNVQNDKIQPDDEISDKDLDKVAGGTLNSPQAKSDGCGSSGLRIEGHLGR